MVHTLSRASDGDIRHRGLFEPLRRNPPTVVFHLAASTGFRYCWDHPCEAFETNVGGTLSVLEFCREVEARLIFLSSYVYGVPEYLPVDEMHPVRPSTPYTRSKVLAEEGCRAFHQDFGVPVVIFRPFNIYGPGQRSDYVIPTMLAQTRLGDRLVLECSAPRRDFVFVEDVVELLLRAVEEDDIGFDVFNVGSGASHSVAELVELLASVSGRPLQATYTDDLREQEAPETVADIQKAKREFGWEPKVDMRIGLSRTWEMVQAQAGRKPVGSEQHV